MIQIRLMRKEDCQAIAEIERSCFSCPWSEQSFLDALERTDSFYLIAENITENIEEREPTLLGYVGVRQSFEEADITNVAVVSEEREKGIGFLLLERMKEEALQRGIVALALEVRASNQAAIGLYQKAGFVVEGIRRGYYQKPKEDALIMWNRCLRGITIEKQKNYPV